MFRARYTIALWVILIVLFVAFYQIFSGPSEGAARVTPTAQAAQREDWLSSFLRWLPLVIAVLLFFFFSKMSKNRYAAMLEGVRLLGQGRYAQALEHFEAHRKAQHRHPAAIYNCGVTRLQLWKLEAALLDFETAKSVSAGKVPELVTLLPEHFALTHALLGREAESRKALAQLPANQGDPGRVALATAILLTRAGDWANARARLGAVEVKQLSGTIGALARAVDAFCIEQLTQERRHIDRVALFGEAAPDELERHWPELVAFVKRTPAW